jgi:glycosyltransferase involved in cell wall biosynthesis
MRPTVSICIVTYNHEQFIAEAIESVLQQKADFKYEIVIGEDCSRDRTREIVSDYQRRYPELIRPRFRERNIGMMENFSLTIQECEGKYIALLDGDDYWTDPFKLRKQVEYLDNNPDLVACFHNTLVTCESDGFMATEVLTKDQKPFSTIEDFIEKEWFFGTATVLFRNGLVNGLPATLKKASSGDWPLYVLLSQYGKFGYLDEVMSVYRIHGNSVTRSSAFNSKNSFLSRLYIYEGLNEALGFKYERLFRKKMLAVRYALLKIALNENDDGTLKDCLRECVRNLGVFNWRQKIVIALCQIKQSLPNLFFLLHRVIEFAGLKSRVYRIADE